LGRPCLPKYHHRVSSMRIVYIACPTNLTLRSANAIQTYTTLRELHEREPSTLALVPRWLGEPSRFGEVGARHLPRPAVGKLSRLYRSTLWYYAERTIFAAMTAAVVAWERLRSRPIDVVYVREATCAGWWAAVWGPLLALPVIFEAHDLESWNPSRAKERWAQPLLHLLDRAALTRSQAVVSLTEDFRRLLASMGWRCEADVAVIADAFDDQQIEPGDRGPARRRLGLPEAAPLVVYSGMTFAYRKLGLLLDAFAPVRARLPDARLIVVGGRPAEIEQLRAQATALALDGAVTWAGQLPQEQVTPYLQAADALVIPDTVTDITASPLKLFEYLAAGRVVVLPDIPALAEVLSPAIGYYFRRGDADALAQALTAALTDELRSQREQAGLVAVAPYTYAARAEQILALAKAVVERYGTMRS
jgi:glycosyltransferase involved in cell wall biosynthesis